MWLLVLLALGVVLIWAFRDAVSGNGAGTDRWSLRPRPLLTEREQQLYERLVAIFPHHVVLAQVALSQLVEFTPNAANRQSIQNQFFRLVSDFVLCKRDFTVVAVIELDDPTHERADRQSADARKTKALTSAGLRLVRIPAGPVPSHEELQRLIRDNDILSDGSFMRSNPPARGLDPESAAVRRSIVTLVVVAVVIAGGWMMYSQWLTRSVPRVLGAQPLALMSRLAPATPAPVRPGPAPAPPTPGAIRPTAAEQADAKRVAAQAVLAAQQAADALAKRKERAWAASYVAPASCEHPPTWKDQVVCGNQYMRAKKEFEQRWQAQQTAAQ